jgi:penicillin amidase
MRNLGLSSSSSIEIKNLTPKSKIFLLSYCDGVNFFLKKYGTPLEFKLLGHKAAPWEPKHCLMILKLMSYLGQAHTQQDMEKFIIHALKENVHLDQMKSLFSPHLDKLDESTLNLIKKVKVHQPFIPDAVKFCPYLPKINSSNNWVISPQKSKTNSCLAAHDPHLEVNRLPAVWYEFIGQRENKNNDYLMGITLPGLPTMMMGRNQNVSMSFTHGFMDMIDYFIEEIKDGHYRRENQFKPLSQRSELFHVKGKSSLPLTIYETDAGILETNSLSDKIEDGLYLSRSWSCHKDGASQTLNSLFNFTEVRNVDQAQNMAKNVSFSGNWIFSDQEGNISFQQSGFLPKRSHSGLFPLPAWKQKYLWKGIHDPDILISSKNPKKGFLCSTNNLLNPVNGPLVMNLHQGHYRHLRLNELLTEKETFDINDMKRIQRDIKSLQAETLLKKLKDYIPNNDLGRGLKNWNFQYGSHSKEASLFEKFYNTLIGKIFGHLFLDKTTLFKDFFFLFDRILLDKRYEECPLWFGSKTRIEFMGEILEKTILETNPLEIKKWGRLKNVMMTNIFFDGNIPEVLGFDYGPIELEGNRSTIVQSGIYRNKNRSTTCFPSYHTVLAGGVSDRKFSPYYMNDIKNWLSYQYKILEADQENKEFANINPNGQLAH